MEGVGARIRKMRLVRNMTQSELARLSNITVAALSRYENDLRTPMSDIISRIARALDTSADYLLTGETSINPNKKAFSNAMQVIGLARHNCEITPKQALVLEGLAMEVFGVANK